MDSVKSAVLLSVAMAAAVEAGALKQTTTSTVQAASTTQPNWFQTSPNAYAGMSTCTVSTANSDS